MSRKPAWKKRQEVQRRQLRWALTVVALGAILVAASMFRDFRASRGTLNPVLAGAPDAAAVSVPPPEPVLLAEADPPASGTGTFVIGTTRGEILGTAGTLKRFRIAVESNVANDDLAEFTRMVDATLGDPRSWIAGKQVRFQRVADGEPYDLTIHLVTRDTAHKMCSQSGLDIRVDGIPYTSCQQWKKVIINLDRWHKSIPDYVDGGVPLETYRQYVINHEVGHELGRGHESCPGKGKPAPTMYRQTLGLNGCTANPWPYLDGKRYAGEPVA